MIRRYAYKIVCYDRDRFGKRAANVRLDPNARPQYTSDASEATLFETYPQAQAVVDGLSREDSTIQYETRTVTLKGGEKVVPDPTSTSAVFKPTEILAGPVLTNEDPEETIAGTGAGAIVVKRGRDRFCYHCGAPTSGGNYLPGHDSKHLAILIADIKNNQYTLQDVLKSNQLPRTNIRSKLVKRLAGVAERFDRDDLREQVKEYTK